MKILWVKHGKILPLDSGGNIRSYNILKYLEQHDDLTYFSYYSGKRDLVYEKELGKHFRKVIFSCTGAPIDTDGIFAQATHYLLRLASPHPYAVTKFTTPEIRKIVRNQLENGGFDVAVCDFLGASLNFHGVEGTPTVLFQHNVEASLWRRQAECEQTWVKRKLFQLEASKMEKYEAAAIRQFPHVIAVSENDRRLMTPFGGQKITVVPTGVDLKQFRPKEAAKTSADMILFTGSMDWEPNVDAMQYFCGQIWPLVLAEIPSAKFVIAGRNPHPSVKSLASSSVEVTGTVPSILKYLDEAAVVVVPLRIGGGTRLKIFEAMAAGNAIVSTSIGAEGLEIHDREDIVLSEEPGDFAQWIVRLIRDKELRQRIGRAAAETAKLHDWSVIAPRFARAIEQVAKSSSKKEDPVPVSR